MRLLTRIKTSLIKQLKGLFKDELTGLNDETMKELTGYTDEEYNRACEDKRRERP